MGATAPASSGPTERADLVRGLGIWSATAIVIGDTIGTGIFLVSSEMARQVGSVPLVFAVWIAGGLIVLFGAFCYAELGAALPRAGGPYVYLSRGLGPIWGFLFGWMISWIERPAGLATLAAGFLRFCGFLFPAVAAPLFVWHLKLPFQQQPHDLTFSVAQPLAAAVIVVITAVNYFSVRLGGAIQIVFVVLKVGAIILLVVLGLVLGKTSGITSAPVSGVVGVGIIGAFLTALVPAMWAYNGFNDLGHLGEEIAEPGRNLPRAILVGLVSVACVYLLANVVYFRSLPLGEVARSQHVASDVVASFAGGTGAKLLTIAMAISALGALHVVALTGGRVPYAMARDGVFFQFAKRIQPTFRTPSGALIFQCSVAVLLALTGTFEELYSLFVFAVWIFFGITAIALIRLRRKEPTLPRPYRAWGYPWTAWVFAIAALALTVNLWLVRPIRSSIGLAVILLGVPFYFRWRKINRERTSSLTG
jgi:APA family basic amino acid/polyamine antiporter